MKEKHKDSLKDMNEKTPKNNSTIGANIRILVN